MASVGSFEKCRKQIERAIKNQQKKGARFAAMDLPFFTSEDQKLTMDYVEQLKACGFVVEQNHIDSSFYGRVSW